MANLTWQNVQAPDFRASMDGVSQFNSGLSQAFDKIGSGLNAFDQSRSDVANKSALMALSALSNPDTAQTDAQAILAGLDPRRVSDQTIAAVNAKPGQLIDRAVKAQDFAHNNAFDALQPQIQQYRDLIAAGKLDDAQKFRAAIDTSKLGAEHALALGQHLDSIASGDIGLKTSRLDYTNKVADQYITDESKNIASQIRGNSLSPDDYGFQLQQLYDSGKYKGYEHLGRLQDAVNAELGLTGANAVGGGGSGGGSASGSLGGGAPGGNAFGMTYGGGQLPDTIKTVGDLVDNKGALLKANGATPVGVYQINAGTWQEFGKQALGDGWRNAEIRSPQAQEAVGKAIFQNALAQPDPAKALQARWASLSPAQAQAMAQSKSWDAAKGVIAKGESGVPDVGAMVANAVGTHVLQGTQNQSEDPTGFRALAAAAQDQGTRSINVVAGELAQNQGIKPGQATQMITAVQNRAAQLGHPITADMAVTILQTSMRSKSQWESFTDPFLHLGSKSHVDTGLTGDAKAIDDKINDLKTGGLAAYAMAKTLRGITDSTSQANTQAGAAAYQRWVQASQQAALLQASGASPERVAAATNIVNHYKTIMDQASAAATASQGAAYRNAINNPQTVQLISDAVAKSRGGQGLTTDERAALMPLLQAGVDPYTIAQKVLSAAKPVATTVGKTPKAPAQNYRDAVMTGAPYQSPLATSGPGLLHAANAGNAQQISELQYSQALARRNGDQAQVANLGRQIAQLQSTGAAPPAAPSPRQAAALLAAQLAAQHQKDLASRAPDFTGNRS